MPSIRRVGGGAASEPSLAVLGFARRQSNSVAWTRTSPRTTPEMPDRDQRPAAMWAKDPPTSLRISVVPRLTLFPTFTNFMG